MKSSVRKELIRQFLPDVSFQQTILSLQTYCDLGMYYGPPHDTVPPHKLIITQVVKEFPVFHGTRIFTVIWTKTCHYPKKYKSSLHLHIPFFTVCINVAILSNHVSSLSYAFSDWNSVWISHLFHTCCTTHPPSHFSLVTLILFGKEHRYSRNIDSIRSIWTGVKISKTATQPTEKPSYIMI
jgi:hypothetical protein